MDRFSVILRLVMGLFLLVIVLLISLAIKAFITGEFELTNGALSSWVTALSTATIAGLTIFLVRETRELRNIQLNQIEQIRKGAIKPSISVVLKESSVELNFLNIHVTNHGAGTAQNVSFTFTNQNPDAQDVFNYVNEQIAKLAFLTEGIGSLGPNHERSSYILNFIDVSKKFHERAFDFHSNLSVSYEDLEGTSYSIQTSFNFRELKGVSNLNSGDPLRKLSGSLEKIRDDIHKFSIGHRRLITDVYNSDDRDRERKERQELSAQEKNDND